MSNLELDWDRALPPLRSTLRLAVFAQRTDNIITNPYEADPGTTGLVVNGQPELSFLGANVGHSSAIGGELDLRGKAPPGWRWNASYSFISITDRLAINRNGIYSPQDYQHGSPTHAVALGGGYTRGQWEFDLEGRWQSRFLDFRADPALSTLIPTVVGNYVVLNARIGYRVTDWMTVALTAEQFNNSHLLQAAAPPVDRRVFLTLTIRR